MSSEWPKQYCYQVLAYWAFVVNMPVDTAGLVVAAVTDNLAEDYHTG